MVAAMTDRPAIEVRGVVKHFGDVCALDGVDLIAHPGQWSYSTSRPDWDAS